jgi:hypothetical protein
MGLPVVVGSLLTRNRIPHGSTEYIINIPVWKHTECNQPITNLEIYPILSVFPYGITHDDGGEAGALENVRGPGLRRRGRRGVQGGENADEDEEAIHLPEDVLCAGILEQDAVDFGEGLLYSTCSCYRQQCILLCM